MKVVQKTCWDWEGLTCLLTSPTSNEVKLSSIVREILAMASGKFRAGVDEHAAKEKGPCASAAA